MTLITNNKQINKICIKKDNIPKEINIGYIGINGQSKLFYYKNNENEKLLPNGYTQLEYITNNKSYISLSRNKIEAYSCECKIIKPSGQNPNYNIMGAIGNSSLLYSVHIQSGMSRLYDTYKGTSHNIQFSNIYNTKFNFKYGVTINSKNYELIIDDDIANKSYERASELSEESLNIPLVIFASYNNSGNISISSGQLYIYSFKIYSDKTMNNLVVNLIPCKNSNSEIGMYDTINKTFYGNANSQGNFTAGPKVVSTSS